ncbi:SDR family NAD(P)-dependent oxidoreductase [Cytophagia bacterium CHB2]|nr:SDR family NAD(P)-dependent oxidoreductase [Cytophagia bacterium CHB2]
MSQSPKTVIVTGASSGIGLDIARTFLEQGANVVLNGRNADKLATAVARLAAPEHTASVAGNVGEKATGEMLVRTAVERFGRVDVLVNNAGSFAPKPFLEVTEEELDGILKGNLRGAYLTTQAAVRQMTEQGAGRSQVLF